MGDGCCGGNEKKIDPKVGNCSTEKTAASSCDSSKPAAAASSCETNSPKTACCDTAAKEAPAKTGCC